MIQWFIEHATVSNLDLIMKLVWIGVLLIELSCVCVLPQNKNLPIENTTDVLSTMASVCKVMLETP